jgi:GxxExxY protein
MSKLILENETHGILGACFEVYREKGCGFTEPVYQDCLELELADRSIQFVPQPEVQLAYKGRVIRSSFRPDFICHRQVILEIKAVSSLASEHEAQVLNYLNATGHPVALLVNFGHYPGLEFKRLVLTDRHQPHDHSKKDFSIK